MARLGAKRTTTEARMHRVNYMNKTKVIVKRIICFEFSKPFERKYKENQIKEKNSSCTSATTISVAAATTNRTALIKYKSIGVNSNAF